MNINKIFTNDCGYVEIEQIYNKLYKLYKYI